MTYSPLAVLNVQDADAGGGGYLLLAMCARGMWYAATHLISSDEKEPHTGENDGGELEDGDRGAPDEVGVGRYREDGVNDLRRGRARSKARASGGGGDGSRARARTNGGGGGMGGRGGAMGCVSIVACGDFKDHHGEWWVSRGGTAGSATTATTGTTAFASVGTGRAGGISTSSAGGIIGAGIGGTGPSPGPAAAARSRARGALTTHTPSIPPPLPPPVPSSHTSHSHGTSPHTLSTHPLSRHPLSRGYPSEPLSLCWPNPLSSSLLEQGMDLYRRSIDDDNCNNNCNNNNNNNNTSAVKENGAWGDNNQWGGNSGWGRVDVTRLVGVSPLHFAVRAGRTEVVRLLMGMEDDDEEEEEEGGRDRYYKGGVNLYQGGAGSNHHHHSHGVSSPVPSPDPRSLARWVDAMDVHTLHPLLLHSLTEGVGVGVGVDNEVFTRDNLVNAHDNDSTSMSTHRDNTQTQHLLVRRAVRAGSRMVHPHHHTHPLAHSHTTGGSGGGSYGRYPLSQNIPIF